MKRPTRILFVNHTAKLGGGELALRSMLRHLDASRVTYEVLLFEDGPLAKLLQPETRVHLLPLAGAVREARKDTLGGFRLGHLRQVAGLAPYLWRLRTLIRGLGVDIVHTNSLKADVLGGIAGLLAGKRVVWQVRDRIAADYLPQRAVRMFRRLTRIIPHAVITNSHATMESLVLPARSGGVSRWKPRLAEVVHDGLDLSLIPIMPAPASGVPATLVVGLVGRISPWKGQDIFLRAIQRIHVEFPAVRFQLIGSPLFGEEAYEAELRALCTQLGLDGCVEFCGFVHNVPEHMASLGVVVHASVIDEPFGQVVIEGMAAGKPVIATRGGGVSEIVEDGVSGMLVPKKDVVALADAMQTLLRDPLLRERLGAGGRRRVQESFRIEFTAAKTMDVYQRLMALGQ